MIELEAWLAVRALGWALVHFLWQGALVAALLELVLFCLRRGSSELRYLVRCGALFVMALAPALTFSVIRAAQPRTTEMQSAAELVPVLPVPWLADAWPVLVVLAWGLGSALLCTRLLRDYLRVRRLALGAEDGVLPREWQTRFEAIARAMGVRAVARVVTSARLGAPVVIGALRPVVLLPVRVLTGLTPVQIEAVIAHELAHVRRHDYLVNLIQSAVEAALFYHPAVWWVSRGIRAEREYCCDDAAVRVSTDRVSYARALTTLESWRSARPAIGMSTLGGSLMVRVQRLIGIENESARPGGALSFLGALLGASMLAAVALGNAAPVQDPEDLQALKTRIEALRARIDELAELTDRLAAHGAQPAQARSSAPAPRVTTLDELLQDGPSPRSMMLHELMQDAHRAQDAGAAHGALRALQGVDAARIREQVHEALQKHGVQDQAHRQALEALQKAHTYFKLDSEHAVHIREQVRAALEQAGQAGEHSAQTRLRVHEHLRKALEQHSVQGNEHIDLQGLGALLRLDPGTRASLRTESMNSGALHELLLKAHAAGTLRRFERLDLDQLHEHLKELQDSGALRRFRLDLDGLHEQHEDAEHDHEEPEVDHHPASHAPHSPHSPGGAKIV